MSWRDHAACVSGVEGFRVVLCGYDHEHDDLLGHGWEVIDGKAGGGAGYSVRSDNGRRERLWLSPEAVKHEIQQGFDFGGAA